MSRSVLIVSLSLAAAGIAAILVVFAALSPFRQLPSDSLVAARFREHRAELEALVAKALPDTALVGAGQGLASFGVSVFVHATPRSSRRLLPAEVTSTGRSEYGTLLHRAGLPALSRSDDGRVVWFTLLSNMSARKGIVYSKEPLTPVRASLDGLERDAGAGRIPAAFVPLAPGWYLFLMGKD